MHRGNRELHRELRREEKRREESQDKYKVGESSRPKTARETQEKVTKKPEDEDEEIKEHDREYESSDSDSGLFEMADMSQADKIVTVSVTHETALTASNGPKQTPNPGRPGSAARAAGQRVHSPAAAALHPLNGLLQPTGRVPQAGYQAISLISVIYMSL